MQAALIYRNELLRPSETFIAAQAGALRRFKATFTGLTRVENGLALPSEPLLLTQNNSKPARLRKALYQVSGIAPIFHQRVSKAGGRLVHAHFAPDGVFAMPLARALDVPLLVTLHGYDATRKQEFSRNSLGDRLYQRRRSKLWERTRVFICVSEFIRKSALAAGFPEAKLRVHYIGSDLEFFTPGAPEAREAKLILFAGRLAPKKGADCLIAAAAEVQRRHPGARTVLIGDGPLRQELEAQAARLGVACTFLGSQPRSVIRDWLWKARVFCAPSVTAADGDSEGLGMVFVEAQATGLPVVSFAHGGIPEAVRHGETGLLAPERDTAQLAEYLCRYLEDEAFWEDSSEAGMRWVKQRFDVKRQTSELEDIYRGVV